MDHFGSSFWDHSLQNQYVIRGVMFRFVWVAQLNIFSEFRVENHTGTKKY